MARTVSRKGSQGKSKKRPPSFKETGGKKRRNTARRSSVDPDAEKRGEDEALKNRGKKRAGSLEKTGKEKKTPRKKGPSLFTRSVRAVARWMGTIYGKARRFFTLKNTIITLIVVCVFFILFQVSWIYALSNKVTDLQNTLTTVEGEVDSKEGRLISSSDIKEVEKSAREYGMTEAKPSQYIYETYSQKNLNTGVKPGLYDYLSMFRDVREGYLWPNK